MSYAPQPMRAEEERTWAILVHVIAGGLNVITGGLFAGLIAAVVMFFLFKDRGPFVRQHVSTTLNFQITLLIGEIIGLILIVIFIGWLVLAAVFVLNIIFSIMGALAANRGELYAYPLTIKFFK